MSSEAEGSKKTLEVKIENLSPSRFEVLELFSRGKDKREIADESEYSFRTLNALIAEIEQYITEDTALDSIEDLNWLIFDDLEPGKSDLAVVAEEILESEKEDVFSISSDNMRKRLESRYDVDFNNLTVGRRFRNIAGYVDMDDEEYVQQFKGSQNGSRWNLSYIREAYREELQEIIEENIDRVQTDDSELGNNRRDENDPNDLVQSALGGDYEEVQFEEIDTKTVYDVAQDFDGTLEEFNQLLRSESESSEVYQISRIKENNSGWAPDAANSSKVVEHPDEIYGEYALLKKIGSGIQSRYKFVEKFDPSETKIDLPE